MLATAHLAQLTGDVRGAFALRAYAAHFRKHVLSLLWEPSLTFLSAYKPSLSDLRQPLPMRSSSSPQAAPPSLSLHTAQPKRIARLEAIISPIAKAQRAVMPPPAPVLVAAAPAPYHAQDSPPPLSAPDNDIDDYGDEDSMLDNAFQDLDWQGICSQSAACGARTSWSLGGSSVAEPAQPQASGCQLASTLVNESLSSSAPSPEASSAEERSTPPPPPHSALDGYANALLLMLIAAR